VSGFDHLRLGAKAAGYDNFAIGFNRLTDGIEALIARAIEKSRVTIRSESTSAFGQPSETMPTFGAFRAGAVWVI